MKYSFICDNCSDMFETEMSINDQVPTDCPQCSQHNIKNTLRKMLNKVNVLKDQPNKVKQVGEVVEQSIKDLKTDLKSDKEEKKARIWPIPQ